MEPVTAYRMNLGELASRVLLMVDDPAGERFIPEVVRTAVNDAMLDISLETQLIIEDVVVQLREGQHLYDLHDAADEAGKRAFAYPLRVVYNDADTPAMAPISTARMDYAGVELEVSSPRNWRTDVFPSGEIVVMPIPSADGSALPALTGNISVKYVAYPTPMINDADYPDTLRGNHHMTLVTRAAEILLYDGGEEDLSVSVGLDAEATLGVAKIIRDQYRGMTQYDSVRPA